MTESPVPPLPAVSLTPFFEPACVAVVGASRERNKIGSEVLHNLVATGFTGAVVPIHPSAEFIQGLKAYPLLVHVPFAVDLAIIVVPAELVPAAVDDCLAKQVPAICIISAGFGECSSEGRDIERGLVEKIRRAGSRPRNK